MVTGAGHGIGAAIAEQAAAEGYRVGVLDIDGERAAAVAAIVDGEALVASTTDEAAVAAVLDRFGTPDVLVNNAGTVRFGPLLEISLADWQAVLDVNLTGTFVCSRLVARRLVAEGRPGSIVNLTSINGIHPGPYAGGYGATKAAVALLTQQLALEVGPARHPRQRRRARPDRRGHVRADLRRPGGAGRPRLEGAARAARHGRRHRVGRAVPRVRRGRVRQRRRAGRGRGGRGEHPRQPAEAEDRRLRRERRVVTRALVLTGGVGHDFEATTGALRALLEADGISTEVSDDPAGAFEALAGDHWDLFVVNALRWRMLAERYAALRGALGHHHAGRRRGRAGRPPGRRRRRPGHPHRPHLLRRLARLGRGRRRRLGLGGRSLVPPSAGRGTHPHHRR